MTYAFLNESRARMFVPRAHLADRIETPHGYAAAQAMPQERMAGGFMQWITEIGREPMDYSIIDRVALIDIHGAICSAQIPFWLFYGDVTYESIVETLKHAVADPDADAVILRFNSPGGTVTGCAEAAAAIDRIASGSKPVIAHAQMADSAAYWLASATNKIVVDPTGEVGSIGVICMHADYSKLYDEYGIKITAISSGAHKPDGNPYAPLTDQALQRFQADMDYLRGQFVGSVAKYRGLPEKQIRATEALTYIGAQAVTAGLADETGFFDDLLAAAAGLTVDG